MIAPAKAFETLFEHITPLAPVTLPLEKAAGHTLAEDITADRDFPPADRTAVDGYALRVTDIAITPATLRLTGEIPAGAPREGTVEPGTCIRVLTGGMIPEGANAVVMFEDTSLEGEKLTVNRPLSAGANIRRQGEEARAGEVLAPAGTRLTPPAVGVAASVGLTEVTVHALPRVKVVCTGAELKQAGEEVAVHQIRDANGPMLKAILAHTGYPDLGQAVVRDDLDAITQALSDALDSAEMVLVTGGVSVGNYDYVPEALEKAGATIHFHSVAIKPGKPLLFATRGSSMLLGLPGNPVSVITAFHEYVLPALKRLSGIPAERCRLSFEVKLLASVKAHRERYHYIPARLVPHDRTLGAEPIHSKGSADLIAVHAADGIIVVPPRENLPRHAFVEFHPWSCLS